jgi:hypothetical protein
MADGVNDGMKWIDELLRQRRELEQEMVEARKNLSFDKAEEGETILYCSFCGKSQHDVRKLIAGPGPFICNECVDLCVSICSGKQGEEDKPPQAPAWIVDDLARTLEDTIRQMESAIAQFRRHIDLLRRPGESADCGRET